MIVALKAYYVKHIVQNNGKYQLIFWPIFPFYTPLKTTKKLWNGLIQKRNLYEIGLDPAGNFVFKLIIETLEQGVKYNQCQQ